MTHMCEECDLEMHEFSGEEGDYNVSGYACNGCGWSFDTERELTARGAERQRLKEAAGFRAVGQWTLCEGDTGAYRALAYTDGDKIENRVAFIEKTPRIRIRHAEARRATDDWLNWASGPFKGDGPFDQESRDWCDKALVLFGFTLLDHL